MDNNIQRILQSYLTSTYPNRQNLRVQNLREITSGWENEMYAFELFYGESGQHQESLVLRIYPGDDAYEKAAHEFQSMRTLEQEGFPVPSVSLLERDRSPFRNPFIIMEHIDGREMWEVMAQANPAEQMALTDRFCELFVELHKLDWQPFVDDPARIEAGDPYTFIDETINQGERIIQQLDMTAMSPYLSWLKQRRDRIPCQRASVIHGDFHPANILLRENGSPVVIDWTGLRVSDARFDLAWTLLLVSMYMDEAAYDQFLDGYQHHAGVRVEQLSLFEAYAAIRRLVSVLASIRGGAQTMGMRPGAEEIMQGQMDVLGKAYHLLVDRTGIRSDELEKWLNEG
ncbi:MAG: phosphotransferase family protein [Chloroflexota bacterium]|nr:phosphotransferase family protein [Chloroflexota bacterium]